MNSQFIISVIGPDLPGILKQLTEVTHDRGGRWINSKICNMDGRFMALIKIDVPKEGQNALQSALQQLNDVEVTIHPLSPPPKHDAVSAAFRIDADDRPGLINDISQLMASHSINIDQLESHRLGVSDTGQSLFTAKLQVTLPAELDPASLARELEGLHEHIVVHPIPAL
ncbi:glycine cleavage system protein R [Ferrimonas gelatinilytica]|uniref:Glycine cleavage system transcriptional repressor n=1 Tax=Ferrimonas gelatinilytica TaxID=1255257 RepID=A0ABP9RZQ7_9GAMM